MTKGKSAIMGNLATLLFGYGALFGQTNVAHPLVLRSAPSMFTERMIVAVAKSGSRALPLDTDDPVQSAYDCMDWVHLHGGGFCEIPPRAFATQRTRHDLYRRYDDVLIKIK